MKNKRLWILRGIALIGSAFLLLNFRIAASKTHTIQRIMTTELQGNYPDRLQRDEKISMVLVGEGPLVSALQVALMEQIGEVGMG